MGSGMPRRSCGKAGDRAVRPGGVVEFYASTQGEVVLANAPGQKVGAMGRPLPGSAGSRSLPSTSKGLDATPSGSRGNADELGRGSRWPRCLTPRRERLDPHSAARRVQTGRRVAGHRRPVPPRRRRGLLALLDLGADPHRARPGAADPHQGTRFGMLGGVDMAVRFGVRWPGQSTRISAVGAVTVRDGQDVDSHVGDRRAGHREGGGTTGVRAVVTRSRSPRVIAPSTRPAGDGHPCRARRPRVCAG